MIGKILKVIGAAVVILIGVLLFNTLTFKSKQLDITATPAPELPTKSLERFQSAIKYKTISFADLSLFDSAQFNGFHRFLRTAYPLVHQTLTLQKLADYSLLYKWEGSDASLAPYVLMAHQDVVPIEEASRDRWAVDPFEGVLKADTIWGRGTTDDKVNLIAILEAVEKLLNSGFQPKRTIYLAFGHDEEVGGTGAKAINAELKSKNIMADLVLDEGGIITRNQVPGMTKPVALIGTSEKGYLSLQLKVEKNGGHSSMPEKETALDILAKAIVVLRENPFPADFTPSTQGFIEHVGPEMPFFQKMAFANTWLLKGAVLGIYESKPGGNALVRTTTVPTLFNAGVKDNVIPTTVTAVVNFRLLPGDNSQYVIDRVKTVINDERVQVTNLGSFVAEATPVTPEDGPAFKLIDEVVHKTFANTVTTPFMMIGATDSRHMTDISKNIIKFSPMTDPIGFHGINERVSVQSYREAIWFFETLLREQEGEWRE
ncbi:MAG TPA: M20 family peptidase [Cyclobacteriaceae bacterium]|nr:M20 family peptidase [Cyclobacteriaceae bacterium]